MRILSVFDGISCAKVALDRVGIPITEYLSSEVDKHAIAISMKNHPDITRLGDVREVFLSHLKRPIDLMIGGSPCQDLSIAKKNRQGLAGDRSGLFWEYVRIKNYIRPRWFILENVASMPAADRDTISQALGVNPVMIDASLVSAQSRKRLFWTNIPFTMPEDRGILLKDILQPDAEVDPSFRVSANGAKTGLYAVQGVTKPVVLGDAPLQVLKEGRTELGKQSRKDIREQTGKDSTSRGAGHKAYFGREGTKANCLTTSLGAENLIVKEAVIRKLTPIECERLQGLPDDYTAGVAKTHRYKALGNAFNVDVIASILRGLQSTPSSPCP